MTKKKKKKLKKKKKIDDSDTKKNINLGEDKCSSRHLMYNYQSDG
jgi:hypothetical protein